MAKGDDRLITYEKIELFFKEDLDKVLNNNNIHITDLAQFYIWNLLVYPPVTEVDRKRAKQPLALVYGQAKDRGMGSRKSIEDLKYIGDICLLVTGFWWNSLARSLVDVDYYIGLGGSAYYDISQVSPERSLMFVDLSSHFKEIVNALIEIGINLNIAVTLNQSVISNQDLLRAYEVWIKTHNRFLGKILVRHGIIPFPIKSQKIH